MGASQTPASVLNLIALIEGLIGVIAQGVATIKGSISSTATVDSDLADADSAYQTALTNANAIIAAHNAAQPTSTTSTLPATPPATS